MKIKSIGFVSSLALAAAIATPISAQETRPTEPEQSSGRNMDIVVTAEFREARLQDTPIAITAINAEMLEARGQTDISQIANQAPNVTLKPQPQNGGAGLIAFIRGVGQTDFNYALDPGVGVYIDDVYIPTLSSSMLELMDLERVEVLRGPQGTLAGKNSIGGAIKLFSAKPDGNGKGSLRATYGSYNRIELRGMADFAITDNLFARVSGLGKSRDGYVKVVDYGITHPDSNVPTTNTRGRGNADYMTQGGEDIIAGRLALRWLPNDRLEINIAGDYTSNKTESSPTVLIAAGAVSADPNAFNPRSSNPATDANGNPWLVGKNGAAVPVNCAFVPAGPYSCDNLTGNFGDPRYITYSNFLDSKVPTSQAPYKPYAALPIQTFVGWGVQGNLTYELADNLQAVWIGSFRKYESKWGQDQDATPVPVAQLDNQLNHEAWSQEVRLNGEVADGLLDFTLGGFYLDQQGEYTARVDLNYAGIDFIHGPDTTPSTTKAVFATATLHPTEALSITGGLRYTKDKKVYTYFRSNPDGTVPFEDWTPAVSPAPICEFFLGAPTAGPTGIGNTPNCLLSGLFGISDTFEGDRWDWRIVADYRFSDELLAYASVSTGFKGGGVNPRPFFGPSAGECDAAGYVAPAPCNQLRSFNPETITTYEAGFKADLFDRALRVNGALFFNKYNDIILTLPACPSVPCLQPRNVGAADVKGAELEFTAFPIDGLTLDGGMSYIDFKYKDVGTSGVPITAVTPYTPKFTSSFGIQYDYDVGAGNMMVRFDGSYQSKVYNEVLNTEWSKVDGYFLGNARIGFTTADDDWNVALEVQNVFDKFYWLTKSDVTASLGLVTGVPALPRTFALSVGRKF